MKKYEQFGIFDFSEYADELSNGDLIQVNGGSCGSGCGGGGPSGGPSYTPPSTSTTTTSTTSTCNTSNPPPENPNSPGGFNDDHKYKNQEEELQNYKDDKKRLSELVNTDKLAEIIAGNLDSLDQATKEYFKSLGTEGAEEKIKQILNGVDVFTGVTSKEQQEVFNELNLEITPKDGLTLGNDIYLTDSKDQITDSNGNIESSWADLLGHEAIHTLQAYVEGEESFIEYCATHEYDKNNEYERAAYNFGGNADDFYDNDKRIKNDNQIFDQYINWWEKK